MKISSLLRFSIDLEGPGSYLISDHLLFLVFEYGFNARQHFSFDGFEHSATSC